MKTITTAIISIIAIACPALAKGPEFRPLFNGKDLSGWKGEGYLVEDGAITCTPKGKNLVTEATFSNYILEFEFKLPPGGNNGLGIHYPGEGDGAYTGMELQVLDNTAAKYKDLKEYQFHGSLYTLQPAKKEGLKPVGEWNKQTVVVNGAQVIVVLNNIEILNANLDELAKSHPDHKGVKRRSGHIAFLGHGDKVAFRNIQIAELAPGADKPPVVPDGFRSLIVGESLKGWKHSEGTTNWTVHNGILKHNGKGGPTTHLWSEASFKNFTLSFDWRWAGRGEMKDQPVVQPDGSTNGKQTIEELDSGIYLRGKEKAQVNLWNWSVGSGEVYGYRTDKNMPAEVKAAVTPKEKADMPLGEWNHMEITMKGEVLNVTLNGKHVIVDATLPGVPAEGPIALQHHGQAIDFANILIKEIP
ncbi:MAG TPA: DUF1080 domain-containing protein [Luteolibacter sp.]|nr:DUF1080 domain-containing protein [Luteolibacter sp.]